MGSVWSLPDLSGIDHLSREQLLEAIRDRAADLPADLLERLDEQSIDWLRLLLLAGRLLRILRHVGQSP